MSKKIIIADAGHYKGCPNGGKYYGYKEDEFALFAARNMKLYMEDKYKDVEVIITRDEHSNPTLRERSEYAVKYGAIGFISWHSNASPVDYVRGPQVYYHMNAKKGKELAVKCLEYILKYTGYEPTKWTKVLSDTMIYKNGFGVLRRAASVVPAVLVETLFHSNKEDEYLLTQMDFRLKVVHAVSDAFADYFGLEKKEDNIIKEDIKVSSNIDLKDYVKKSEIDDYIKRYLNDYIRKDDLIKALSELLIKLK